MKAKVLSLFVLAALSGGTLAATPPDTLIVVQSLDDIVSLDPQKVTSCLAFRQYRASISA